MKFQKKKWKNIPFALLKETEKDTMKWQGLLNGWGPAGGLESLESRKEDWEITREKCGGGTGNKNPEESKHEIGSFGSKASMHKLFPA